MDDKITLDRKAFKVLASETRIKILKSLGKRRKMLAELSKELGMSNSAVKEHLENLAEAGLIAKIDDGHKWKYYELTRKGKNILTPGETKIWVILSASALAVMLTAYDMATRFYFMPQRALNSPALFGEAAKGYAGSGGAGISYVPYLHIILIVVFSVLFGLSAAYLFVLRRNMKNSI